MEKGTEVYSGHESFPCRYGWLPKLHEAIAADPDLFGDDEAAMVKLGLGKNMVRSIRFWGVAFGLASSFGRRIEPTRLAHRILDPVHGADPYLEGLGSLWRLHWRVTTKAGLGAWTAALIDNQDRETTRQGLVDRVQARASRAARVATTSNTVAAHVDVFLRTYDAGRQASSAVVEETLGSPFQELGLLEVADVAGTPTVRFRRGPQSGLGARDLAFALRDFWEDTAADAGSVTFLSVMMAPRAPGVVFGLDEATAHSLLTEICAMSDGAIVLREDGAGGLDVACIGGSPLQILENVAWA